MRGNYSFDYACSLARGRSGGLISMWDPNNFVKDDIWCDDAFITVKGRWKNSVEACYMINIYGPHDPLAKSALWDRICDFMHCNRGKYILFGDMNEVRNAQECYGSIFSSSEPQAIKTFEKIIIEEGSASNEDCESRLKLLHDLDKLDTLEAMDYFQKGRIKWDVKGEENTKFFYCLINQKRRCNSIKGIMHEGAWVTDPQLVKQIFLNFFKCKFQANDSLIDFPLITTSSRLNDVHCAFLKANACMVEVKDAVWDCGSDKPPVLMGLKINVHKSSIYGIGVASDDVQIMAANTGCSAGTLPLTYLSLPIGSNMSLFVNWKPLVDKFRLKLSNLLAYGGRLTLIKGV
ncbi:RNA-directed DNA polymerase, eukaryota, reverse transcriptase zinc-binding domain protein [Tanacetum coccineum]